ncbi:hypothetical protein Vadar_005348 [Vaccinium darrowii]|uniref:Uncharacterized protein n=1 Tax=Vaccinium darrowii TaxID=229202 RepID=A0ACB7ZHP3_9ERIC|nr:hypothetical protein Vadar_005348 [Vaccinium darrowii]
MNSHGSATVFVDNLPVQIRKIWVYNLFSKYGKIRDIYIPNKKSKVSGRSFGFVRFVLIKDAEEAIAEVNNSWYWGMKLRANFARFQRKEDIHIGGSNGAEIWKQNDIQRSIWHHNNGNPNRAEAWKHNAHTNQDNGVIEEVTFRIIKQSLVHSPTELVLEKQVPTQDEDEQRELIRDSPNDVEGNKSSMGNDDEMEFSKANQMEKPVINEFLVSAGVVFIWCCCLVSWLFCYLGMSFAATAVLWSSAAFRFSAAPDVWVSLKSLLSFTAGVASMWFGFSVILCYCCWSCWSYALTEEFIWSC